MSTSSTPLQTFLDALAAKGFETQPDSNGYRCRCPGHVGKKRSLAIKEAPDGTVLLTCFAQACDTKKICAALSICEKDLFPGDSGDPKAKSSESPKLAEDTGAESKPESRFAPPNPSKTVHPTAKKAAAAVVWSLKSSGHLHEKRDPDLYYMYFREEPTSPDDVLFAVLRWNLTVAEQDASGETKIIRPVSQVMGGWQSGNPYDSRPLYGLFPKAIDFDDMQNVAEAGIVYVCEGEKACTALLQLGLNAVSPSQGAQSPGRTDWSVLNGKEIILVPDYDEAGKKFVRSVLRLITEQAPDATVEVKQLWDDIDFAISEKDDAADWSAFYDSKEPAWLREKLVSLPNRVEGYQTLPDSPEIIPPNYTGKPASELWEKADEPIPWLVKDVFSADQPTIFGAKRKCLKTTMLTDLAVSLASGLPFLGHFEIPRKFRTLFVTGESNERAAMRRIRRAGRKRNLSQSDFSELWVEAIDFPKLPQPDQIGMMAESVRERKIEVVILDPLYRGMDGSVNASNLFEVGDCLGNFMAAMRPVPVIIAHHFRKNTEFQDGIPDLDDLAQAGIAEFAGNFWLVARNGSYDGDGRHDLAVLYGGRDEQYGLKRIEFDERAWSATITDLTAHREHVRQQKENEKVGQLLGSIMKELSRTPEGMSESAIADAVSQKKTRLPFKNAITELEERGSIICIPKFKAGNGQYCKAWKVAELGDKE